MAFTVDDIRTQLPHYLTQDQKISLVNELNDFPDGANYYSNLYPDEILQGDGWSSIQILRFEDGKRDSIQGIIISNSCDIDSKNKRSVPPLLTFAPLISVEAYKLLLKKIGWDEFRIGNQLKTISLQKVNSLFYLPKGGELNSEYIALLGDLHTIPVSVFEQETTRTKLFTLSQVGFYIFLIKLSIHFCRFHEELHR